MKPPEIVRLTPGKRVLFLTKDPELIRRQLRGELDLRMDDLTVDDLLDDINTDAMTPAWVCFSHRPEDIARLEAGDPIVVETADAFYVYETTESLIVQPEDVEVIAPTPGRPGVEPTERMLTLTACHPMYSARERIIVHAEFSYWTKRSDGIPEALAQDAGAGTEES